MYVPGGSPAWTNRVVLTLFDVPKYDQITGGGEYYGRVEEYGDGIDVMDVTHKRRTAHAFARQRLAVDLARRKHVAGNFAMKLTIIIRSLTHSLTHSHDRQTERQNPE